MKEAVKFSFNRLMGKPWDVLRLTFLNGTFHVRFRGARLCFDCIKTLALAIAKGELLLIVAIYGSRRERKTAPDGRSFNDDTK